MLATPCPAAVRYGSTCRIVEPAIVRRRSCRREIMSSYRLAIPGPAWTRRRSREHSNPSLRPRNWGLDPASACRWSKALPLNPEALCRSGASWVRDHGRALVVAGRRTAPENAGPIRRLLAVALVCDDFTGGSVKSVRNEGLQTAILYRGGLSTGRRA